MGLSCDINVFKWDDMRKNGIFMVFNLILSKYHLISPGLNHIRFGLDLMSFNRILKGVHVLSMRSMGTAMGFQLDLVGLQCDSVSGILIWFHGVIVRFPVGPLLRGGKVPTWRESSKLNDGRACGVPRPFSDRMVLIWIWCILYILFVGSWFVATNSEA